jgi:predicted  nucleic acid-binding Zn-ribbon protein
VGERRGVRRMPLREAADALGISKDAVRQRIRRDTLQSDKGEDGRVYVYLDASADDVQAEEHARDDLVDELRDRVRYLESQIEEERDARRRADTLLAQLMQRIPELEAPSEPRESPQTVEEEPEWAEPRSAKGRAQESARRPWWRRWFCS